MQIRCERIAGESCTRCVTRKLVCTTTPVERRKGKVTKYQEVVLFLIYQRETNFDHRKKEEYFDEIEDRIKRMESAITASTLHGAAEAVEEKGD